TAASTVAFASRSQARASSIVRPSGRPRSSSESFRGMVLKGGSVPRAKGWGGNRLDLGVDERWPTRRQRSGECAVELARAGHAFAVRAEGRRDAVVAHAGDPERVERRPAQALLDLHLGVPPAVVADHKQELDAVTDGGVELGDVVAAGAVALEGEDARVRPRELRPDRERERRADG